MHISFVSNHAKFSDYYNIDVMSEAKHKEGEVQTRIGSL